jgi:Uncharacterized protein conserved in bacteria
MQDFLFLFIGGERGEPSPEEMQKSMERWFAWIREMKNAGIYHGGYPLDDGGKTIRGAERVVTDGPFAEAKELVGGYMLLRVKDLDEAVRWARGCPGLDVGTRVEVRPIVHLEGL